MKYKNYRNSKTQDNRIYTNKDIKSMSLGEIFKRKDELLAQNRAIGVPKESELRGSENVVYVHEYTREDGTQVKAHWRSKSGSGTAEVKENGGTVTGGASKIDRKKEEVLISKLPKNNDEFFEKERNKPHCWLMRVNAELNSERPDAKLFMDIALAGPDGVPSTQDYQISTRDVKYVNKKYNLTGNKKIPRNYKGFEFSKDSPTAERLNNSEELKREIFDEEKNFNSKTGEFKSDKLEIEFKKDKNLQYSFGHITVLNPKMEDGYVTGMAYDKYDYKWFYSEYKNQLKTSALNNSAKLLQSVHHLRNYYVLVPIKVKIH